MKSQRIGSLSEIIGALAIVVSLIFVAMEINQNTVAQNAAVYQEMSRDARSLMLSAPNEVRNKARDGERLTAAEESELFQWYGATMRTYENWWQQNQLGTIDDQTFESYMGHMAVTLGDEAMRDYWTNRRTWSALPGFEKYVSMFISENPLSE